MVLKVVEFLIEGIGIFAFVMTPLVMIWGWWRWTRRDKQWTIAATFSLTSFALATTSALLAISSVICGRVIGGFPYYDPRLMRIYTWGTFISATSIVLALVGIARRNSLRWHALFCGVGTLVYWFTMAESE